MKSEKRRSRQIRPKISLLHATFHREGGPLEVKETWLGLANRPDLIEYIFAMDADDGATLFLTKGHTRVINPSGDGHVTAVRNWNAAAAVAGGDLLMVIADDLFPPQGWDTALTEIVGSLDTSKVSFAIKLTDSPSKDDTLIQHPVISRGFYQRHGLFSESYAGVYCDNDITLRAFWRSAILDGRSLILDHRSPTANSSLEYSESQRRLNTDQEYKNGKTIFDASWSRRQRVARIGIVPVASGVQLTAWKLRGFRWKSCVMESVAYPFRGVKWVLLKLISSYRLSHQ